MDQSIGTFLAACACGSVEQIKRLTPEVNYWFVNKGISVASRCGNLDAVLFLTENKDSFKVEGYFTALRWAVCHGHTKIVKHLIEVCGANEFATDHSLAWYSVANGHLETTKYLVETRGLNIAEECAWGLSLACEEGYLDVVKYCVKLGANVSFKEYQAFILACVHGRVSIVSFLMGDEAKKWYAGVPPGTELYGFNLACGFGRWNTVSYLLSMNSNLKIPENSISKYNEFMGLVKSFVLGSFSVKKEEEVVLCPYYDSNAVLLVCLYLA